VGGSAASDARGAAQAGAGGARSFVVEMAGSPAIALAAFVLVAIIRPSALAAAAPLLSLWAAAPLIACALSRPIARESAGLGAQDREFLRAAARKSWGFFAAFMGPEDHGLPPDNYQTSTEPRIAHRTSPTNIGFACCRRWRLTTWASSRLRNYWKGSTRL